MESASCENQISLNFCFFIFPIFSGNIVHGKTFPYGSMKQEANDDAQGISLFVGSSKYFIANFMNIFLNALSGL